MDEVEKNILRRRRADLADSVEVTRDLLLDLRACGLLAHDALQAADQEKTNAARMDRVLDSILLQAGGGPSEGFQGLCRVLARSSTSLTAELEAELGLERGIVRPRDEMILEAEALVNRKFGRSKRFSDVDRREVIELIAAKLQLAHDEWKREAAKIETALARVRGDTASMDERCARASSLLAAFAQRYEGPLLSHASDPGATRAVLGRMTGGGTSGGGGAAGGGGAPGRGAVGGRKAAKGGPGVGRERDGLAELQRNLKDFFKQVEVILDDRDSLFQEKERCLRLLQVKDDKVQLDQIVGKLTGLSITSSMGVEPKDAIIARLKIKVAQLDSEANEYERSHEALRRELAEKERELSNLRHNVHID